MSERRGPIGWVVVYRSKDDELRVEQQYTNLAPYVMTDRAEAEGWCGECNDAEAECGGSGTYTVEPVGIGGAPDEALRALRKLVDAIDVCEPAIKSAFAFQYNHGMHYGGPTYKEALDSARRALAREATNQGGQHG